MIVEKAAFFPHCIPQHKTNGKTCFPNLILLAFFCEVLRKLYSARHPPVLIIRHLVLLIAELYIRIGRFQFVIGDAGGIVKVSQ